MPRNLLVAALLCSVSLLTTEGSATDAGTVVPGREGASCRHADDCEAELSCGFPAADGCAAQGVCMKVRRPGVAHCMSIRLQCGCDGTMVSVPCDYPVGFTPAPINGTSLTACRGSLVRPVHRVDAGTTVDGR